MTRLPVGRRMARPAAYGAPMKTNDSARRLPALGAGVATLAIIAMGLGACSNPVGSAIPSVSIPASVAIPSVTVSAAASAAAQAAIAALDKVDTQITANQTASGLTADDANSLKQLTAGVRTALQTGDTAAAKTAVQNLSTKIDSLSAKLSGDNGKQMTDAITALKTALGA
jgi:hypothetical protein